MAQYLEFEKPIAELEGKIEELRHLSGSSSLNIADEVARLQQKVERQIRQTYAKLTPWQKVQVARHPERPHAVDYISALVEDWTPLAGDRLFGEDLAILGGIGRIDGRSCVVLGQERGQPERPEILGPATRRQRPPLAPADPHGRREGRCDLNAARQLPHPTPGVVGIRLGDEPVVAEAGHHARCDVAWRRQIHARPPRRAARRGDDRRMPGSRPGRQQSVGLRLLQPGREVVERVAGEKDGDATGTHAARV